MSAKITKYEERAIGKLLHELGRRKEDQEIGTVTLELHVKKGHVGAFSISTKFNDQDKEVHIDSLPRRGEVVIPPAS
jgi:hypothetical protein